MYRSVVVIECDCPYVIINSNYYSKKTTLLLINPTIENLEKYSLS